MGEIIKHTAKNGQHIIDILPEMLEKANKTGVPHFVELHEIKIVVKPGDRLERVIENYFSELSVL
jgi:hypothetical protein